MPSCVKHCIMPNESEWLRMHSQKTQHHQSYTLAPGPLLLGDLPRMQLCLFPSKLLSAGLKVGIAAILQWEVSDSPEVCLWSNVLREMIQIEVPRLRGNKEHPDTG